jgi:hypothetical protein
MSLRDSGARIQHRRKIVLRLHATLVGDILGSTKRLRKSQWNTDTVTSIMQRL